MNWLDIVIIVCVSVGLIKGLFAGFIKQVVSFLALIAAIFFAGQVALVLRALSLHVDAFSSMNQVLLNAICYALAFSLIIILIVLLGRIINIAIKMTPAKWLNTLLGGLFGALIWIFSLSIACNLLYVFDLQSQIIKKETQEKSILYEQVKSVVPTVYPFIREYFKNKKS
jgi:membrane protein required for colicin V production